MALIRTPDTGRLSISKLVKISSCRRSRAVRKCVFNFLAHSATCLASWISRQILFGRSGSSLISMPNGLSASHTSIGQRARHRQHKQSRNNGLSRSTLPTDGCRICPIHKRAPDSKYQSKIRSGALQVRFPEGAADRITVPQPSANYSVAQALQRSRNSSGC